MAKNSELLKFERRVREEKRNIREILEKYDISEDKRALLVPVIENVAWMKAKLDQTRELIELNQIVSEYDNGGGQTGVRENPLFKGYENLWKSYLAGWKEIKSCLPEANELDIKHGASAPVNVLELVKRKKKEA